MTRQEQVRIETQDFFSVLWKWIPHVNELDKNLPFWSKMALQLGQSSCCDGEYNYIGRWTDDNLFQWTE